jgi:hypothetical protein
MESVPLPPPQRFIYTTVNQLGHRPSLQLDSCLRIEGAIDTARFKRAAEELATRHPVLCTLLCESGDDVFQRHSASIFCFEVIDIHGDPGPQANAILSARADQPFNLFEENPFRVILARCAPDKAFLMLLGHHLVVDRIALQALTVEYVQLYLHGPAHAGNADWDTAGRSFRTWAIQHEKMLQDGALERNAQYWLNYLRDAEPVLHLPQRQPDPAVQSTASIRFSLDDDELQVLRSRARQLGVSHFTLVTAAIFHALREETAQDDILLSMVTDTRRPPFERTIGNFAAMTVLRQQARDGGLENKAIEKLFDDIFGAVSNYISFSVFSDQIAWLNERRSKGYSMCEAFVDYLPTGTNLPINANSAKVDIHNNYKISRFYLAERVTPTHIPYHGVLLGFYFGPGRNSLQCSVEYESAIITPQSARSITTSLRTALTGGS